MKKIIVLVVLLIFSSCDIQYDGETKLVVKGNVLDENNVPFSNKKIKLFVTNSDGNASFPFPFYVPSETNFIGKATTDSNGNFTMVIPQPKNFSQIIVETNSTNNELNEQQFINIKLDNFTNYELILPIVKLYNKSGLTLLTVFTNQTNPNNQLLDIDFIGEIPNEIVAITPLETNYPFQEHLKVRKNQTLVISYTVKNIVTNITSVLQQNVVIDSSPQIDYTLNY